MKEEDLEQFAVADGLLARMAVDLGYLSQREKDYLLVEAAGRSCGPSTWNPRRHTGSSTR
jgi:hypothetical protein